MNIKWEQPSLNMHFKALQFNPVMFSIVALPFYYVLFLFFLLIIRI